MVNYMQKVLQHYLKRLTNLSGNNRSLLLLRLLTDQFIDIHSFDFVDNKPSFNIIAELIAGKTKIKLSDIFDSRNEVTNQLSLRLKRLHRVEKYIYQERGAKDLYVGWPFARGKFADGTPVRSPLLFFPVELENDGKAWNLNVRSDVNVTFNKSFLLAYSHYNKVVLTDDFIERVFDDFDKDSTVFRTSLYQLIKESPVEINFNQENFLDQLADFINFKKNDFVNSQKDGEIKLYPEAALGIFPQAGSYLVPDYMHLLENERYADVEDFFYSRTLQEDKEEYKLNSDSFYAFLNKVKEEETFTPFKMDAFQENAIKAVKRGNSLVVQGPPGTGKSQMICNLISDFIARGKTVLLVCQKKAALDVVHARLKEQGISDFVALVHDFKNDRKAIYEQISNQIERLYEYKLKNNSLDSIQLERNFLQSSRKIDQITEELEEFKHALFDEKEAGVSIKELYLTSNHDEEGINVKQEYNFFKLNEVQPFLDKIDIYFEYYKKFSFDDYLWRIRKPFTGYGISDLQRMREIISEIPAIQDEFSKKVEKLLGFTMDFNSGIKIYEGRDKILQMCEFLDNETVYRYFSNIIQLQESTPDLLWLNNSERNLLTCFKDGGPEISLSKEELGKVQQILKERMDSKKNIFKFIGWSFFSKEKNYLKKVLQENGLTSKKKDLKVLERKIDNRLNFEHNLTKLREIKWLLDMPESFQINDFINWFDHYKKAVGAMNVFYQFRNFTEYFSTVKLSLNEFKEKSKKLVDYSDGLPLKKQSWLKYFYESRIDNLLAKPDMTERMLLELNADFDSLCDFDNLIASLQIHEKHVIEKLIDTYENTGKKADIKRIFLNSLSLAWIEYLESKYPVLRTVNSLRFEKMQKDLQEEVKNKLKASNEIVLLRARERTYETVEFNKLNNMVTYRDLSHQVTKKRMIWPIRRVITTFPDEVFNLVPCWMASPESVSAIFPMEQMFDLVIFDEASQCFAERGIPAMYRGKQIVITGDAQQLSPFDLYKVRWDDEQEDNEEPALEVDSLLDLGSKYLMQVQLKGHYRSKSLDLIDFSNQIFYKGNLTLLPDKNIVNSRNPAIEYVKIDGNWEKNKNIQEAEKVVEIYDQISQIMPDKEIGIITFNAQQQDLILDLLDNYALEKKVVLPDSLFVKNIENVQGDEKDIIIFSIAYAPDKKGVMRHQFGSLNIQKGENRLNVAVTRAREKVIVVSSIYPQQLKIEDTKNEGPKILRKYLQYAFDVSEGRFKPTISPRRHAINWYLKEKIKESVDEKKVKFQFIEEMPFSDLTVKKGDKYLGLILTDDDLYYQSISIKDMHVYIPFTLSSKNWKFRGILSREYWHDKENVKDILLKFAQYCDTD